MNKGRLRDEKVSKIRDFLINSNMKPLSTFICVNLDNIDTKKKDKVHVRQHFRNYPKKKCND